MTTENCKFAGYGTSGYTTEGKWIITQTPLKSNKYKETLVDIEKKEADFLIISIGSKPCISWKNGPNERLKSRKALEKLQAKFKWKNDF
jgi:hypothetical protein